MNLTHLGIATMSVVASILSGDPVFALANLAMITDLGTLRREHAEMTAKIQEEFKAMRCGDNQNDMSKLKSVLGKPVPDEATAEERRKCIKDGLDALARTTDELTLAEQIYSTQADTEKAELIASPSSTQAGVHVSKAALDRLEIPESVIGKSPEDLVYEALEAFKSRGGSFRHDHAQPVVVEVPVMPDEWGGDLWRDKVLFQRSAGWLPERRRTDQVVPFAYEPVQLLEVIPRIQTRRTHVDWMEQTTRRAAPTSATTRLTAEGAAVREGELVWTARSAEVRKIASSIPVTSESLEDAPMVSGLINMNLRDMLMEDTEALLFEGETNFTGFNTATSVNTKSMASTVTNIARVDAVSEMAATIRKNGKSTVSHVCVSPITWHKLATIRGDDNYLFGSPATMIGKRIWGFPVIVTTFLDETSTKWNLIMGNFTTWSRLAVRRGVTVEIGTTGTQFVEMKRTILASHRCILQILRPSAFGRMKLYT